MAEVLDRIRPDLDGVPETLLIPLWARAQEQSQLDPIIVDPTKESVAVLGVLVGVIRKC